MEILAIVTLGACGFVLGWIGRGIHTQHMAAKFHRDMIQHVLDHAEQVICYKMEPSESGELGEPSNPVDWDKDFKEFYGNQRNHRPPERRRD